MKERNRSVDKYVLHAKRYGAEEVFETAQALGWPANDLGALAARLRRVNDKWRLSREQAHELAVRLAAEGCPPADIARRCGISRPTVRKALSEAASAESLEGVHPLGSIGPNFASEAA